MFPSTQLTRLAAIVGEEWVRDPAEWCGAAGWADPAPEAIVYPSSEDEICELLRFASSERLKITPAGAGTKQRMGGAGAKIDFLLSLTRVQGVVDYPFNDLTISARAGTPLASLSRIVAEKGQILPLDMPFFNCATLGGSVAVNASGPRRLAYGTWRDFVLGMRFVTADGRLAKGGGKVVKNVAGYDLPKLLIGSFGTLGVIVEVTLKTFPKPAASATFLAGFDQARDAVEAGHRVLHSALAPQAMDIVDAEAASLAGMGPLAERSYSLVIQAAGPAAVVRRFEADLPSLLGASQTMRRFHVRRDDEERRLWQTIEEFTPTFLYSSSGRGLVVKASVPLTAIADLIETAKQIVWRRAPGAQCCTVARAASGIVYCHLSADGTMANSDPYAAGQIVEHAEALGGRAVVEWCPAALKSKIRIWGTMRDDFPAMQRLKSELDPARILNPGRFYGGI